MRGLFRTKEPTVTSKSQKTARQQNSMQEASSESGLEMVNMQQARNSSITGATMAPISSDFMAVIQSGRSGGEQREISSGFVMLENSMQAIALDPRMVSQYSRKDVKIILDTIFFLSAAIAASAGIVLWINSLYGITWTILTLGGLFMRALEYFYFVLTVVQKARIFKKKPGMVNLTGGRRAPPSSINDGPDSDPEVEPRSVSDSSEPVFDPQDRVDADRSINALPPRRRQTFEAPNEDAGDTPRHPARTDTEANIGL
jgi:hypothetical protein